jgi:uncharacterized damage-inducible protein DinB
MSEDTGQRQTVEALPGADPTIGRWLWTLEDTRRLTKDVLMSTDPAVVDRRSASGGNSIGTLLHHIAAIELDWLYTEVLEEQPWPPEIEELFPWDIRDERGQLMEIHGMPMVEHLRRLDAVRRQLLAAFREMTPAEFRRIRHFPSYDVTPEWVLHHLVQHEAEHRGQIQLLATLASQTPEGG